MTSAEFRNQLSSRSSRAGAAVPDWALDLLEAYFHLLARWNPRINLTALPLDPPTDATFDRLFVEPLAAVRCVDRGQSAVKPGSDPPRWLDLGSGGGSPAIPMKIARPYWSLTMVESKARKAAFLKEAARSLELTKTAVSNERFETFEPSDASLYNLVTVRGVKADAMLFEAVARLLRKDGELAMFGPTAEITRVSGFSHLSTDELGTEAPAFLIRYGRVFHVEQSR
jgi:16S rRNA (guanine527-N7)-methyltransferase